MYVLYSVKWDGDTVCGLFEDSTPTSEETE
jgi:hypothetical protein